MDELRHLEQEYKDIIKREFDSEARVVFGEGMPNASIFLIGEAPGKNEEETGRAFVGAAGKNLDEFLKVLDISRQNIYITNVVKIRPTKENKETGRTSNRTPNKKEIEASINTLMSELEIIKPKMVVTLGNIPLRAVLGNDNAKIGDYHGSKVNLEKYDLFPLYHPASIIYNRSLYETYIEDVIKLKEYI